MANAVLQATQKLSGVNVAGYLTAESGVGEAARGYVHALRSAGIAVALNNYDAGVESRKADATFASFSETNPYPINLICINADQLPAFRARVGEDYFKGKYNIGVWWWELPEFPQEYWESFRWLDELWVGSYFVQHALSLCSPIPVVRIPPAVTVSPRNDRWSREQFGMSDDEFVFLYMFDFFSGFERKNPLAVIRAFRQAFNNQQPVRLIMKCINSKQSADKLALLTEAIGDARVMLLDEYLSSDQTSALISCCDSYVSLHRSEGLGIPLVEAMLLRKPVIATGWSGNADFMNAANSFPIPYKLVVKDTDGQPYRAGEIWAEANEGAAASAMRSVYENRENAALIAAQGVADAVASYSEEAVGSLITSRLAAIKTFTPRLDDAEIVSRQFLLDQAIENQLEIISSGSSTIDAARPEERSKTLLRKLIMPVVERAGYLNSIYSQLFRRLFRDFAAYNNKVDLIDSRTRKMLAASDARIRALEEQIEKLRQEMDK